MQFNKERRVLGIGKHCQVSKFSVRTAVSIPKMAQQDVSS